MGASGDQDDGSCVTLPETDETGLPQPNGPWSLHVNNGKTCVWGGITSNSTGEEVRPYFYTVYISDGGLLDMSQDPTKQNQIFVDVLPPMADLFNPVVIGGGRIIKDDWENRRLAEEVVIV